jgi:DNA-binding winged helix-turn-helix (wHTH) protein/TolB-like protein
MDLRAPRIFAVNGVIVDVAGQVVRDRHGHEIALRPQAFDLLKHLLENAGRLVTKDELMKAVWPGVFVTDDSLVQCVRDIRRALNDESQSVLKAVPKRGYRLTIPTVDPPVAAPRKWAAAGTRRMRVAVALALGLVLGIIAAGVVWRSAGSSAAVRPANPLPVVVVERFVDVTGSDAVRGLGVGICNDFATALSRLREFHIVVRDPPYNGSSGDPLAVDFVVGGAVHHEGDRLRITAHLVETKSSELLWSEQWDRPDKDVLAVQAEIAGLITNRLGGNTGLIQEVGRLAARRKSPDDLTAYELYLLATEKLGRFNRADAEDAVRLLDRSAELDPGLARTWTELYLAYDMLAEFGVEPERSRQAAANAAVRAVELSPTDPKSHAIVAMSLTRTSDFVRGRSEFDTALTLAPTALEILTLYAGSASHFGEAGRGADAADQVVRLHPNLPMSAPVPLASAYFMAGRYQDSIAMVGRLGAENHTLSIWAIHAAALAAVGRREEALEWVGRAVAARPDLTIEMMANEVGYTVAEQQRFIDTMRVAGFPACASAEVLAEFDKPRRLPECQTDQGE